MVTFRALSLAKRRVRDYPRKASFTLLSRSIDLSNSSMAS